MQNDDSMPERELISAIVQRGIIDATTPDKKLGGTTTELDKNQAKNWINSDVNHRFSFLWCCDLMGVSPNNIRYIVNYKPMSVYRQIVIK